MSNYCAQTEILDNLVEPNGHTHAKLNFFLTFGYCPKWHGLDSLNGTVRMGPVQF
jgi:hypothetical protein